MLLIFQKILKLSQIKKNSINQYIIFYNYKFTNLNKRINLALRKAQTILIVTNVIQSMNFKVGVDWENLNCME